MKSTILIQLIALPAILASNIVELVIVAKEDLDAPQVIGRMDPSQNMTRMTSTSREIPHELLCLGDDEMWTHWGCDAEDNDKGRPLYRQIAQFNFAEFTKDPRPFIVMTDSSRPEHLRMCNITVTREGNPVWDVQGGFLGQTSDAVKIDCGPDLTQQDTLFQGVNGTEWEKKVWADVHEMQKADNLGLEQPYATDDEGVLESTAA